MSFHWLSWDNSGNGFNPIRFLQSKIHSNFKFGEKELGFITAEYQLITAKWQLSFCNNHLIMDYGIMDVKTNEWKFGGLQGIYIVSNYHSISIT